MAGKLTIVPTPLGNLGDMTSRALDALRAADVVCAEDTRVTGRLLAALGVEGKRLERLDESLLGKPANRAYAGSAELSDGRITVADAIASRVLGGEVIAYCSDAGMPGVSDPGLRLVEAARAAGAPVEVLPGPTAVATAYVASGFTCSHFYFGGFFPRKGGERRRTLQALASLDAVLLFYESPNRIADALAAVAEAMPHRRVAVCRELTKLHEEVFAGSVSAAAEEFARREREGGVKGEIVLVIDAPLPAEDAEAREETTEAAEARAAELLTQGECTKKDVVAALQREFGLPRNEAYQLVHGVQGK